MAAPETDQHTDWCERSSEPPSPWHVCRRRVARIEVGPDTMSVALTRFDGADTVVTLTVIGEEIVAVDLDQVRLDALQAALTDAANVRDGKP